MARFYLPIPYEIGPLKLPESTAHHAIRVRRMRVGEQLTLFNGENSEATALLTTIGKESYVDIIAVKDVNRESPLEIILVQALPSMEKMDYIIQKSIELGVTHIQPIITRRSQKLEGKRAENKIRHWEQLAISACEQSGRTKIPTILSPQSLEKALSTSSLSTAYRLWLDPTSTLPLTQLSLSPAPRTLMVLVGSEGGFDQEEAEAIVKAGFTSIRIGPRILRAETAGPTAIALCQARWGDFN